MADKVAAFRSYDFDSDASWTAYCGRLEVPAGREAALIKFKARWYQNNVDSEFDPKLVTEEAQGNDAAPRGASTAGNAAPSRSAPSASAPSRSAPSASAPSRSAPSASPPPAAVRSDLISSLLLVSHTAVILLTLLALQPLHGGLGRLGSSLAPKLGAALGVFAMRERYGLPGGLRDIKSWMERATASPEFFRMMLGMVLSGNPRLMFGLISLAVYSLFTIRDLAQLLRTRGKLPAAVDPLFTRFGGLVNAHSDRLRVAQAAAEISTTFVATLDALSTGIRGAGTAWVLWNQMRLRKKGPESGPYHAAVWTALGQRIAFIVARVPALQKAIDFMRSWFDRA